MNEGISSTTHDFVVDEAETNWHRFQAEVGEKAATAMRGLRENIAAHPVRSVALGLALGAALARLVGFRQRP